MKWKPLLPVFVIVFLLGCSEQAGNTVVPQNQKQYDAGQEFVRGILDSLQGNSGTDQLQTHVLRQSKEVYNVPK